MTASAGIRTHGTKIAIGDGSSPEVFTKLGEATSIGEFGESRGTVDFSNHDTPSGPKDYKLQSLSEGDEFPVQANYVEGDAGATAFRAACAAGTSPNIRITLTNSKTRTMPCLVLNWKENASELDGRMTASFSLKIVGAITRA